MTNPEEKKCECEKPDTYDAPFCGKCGLPIHLTAEPKSPQKEAIDHLRNMQLDNLELSSNIPFITPPVEGEWAKTFDEIRCKSGSVGLATNDLKDSSFYNIHKCGICGRKWHIYEQAPICQKYREKYPDEKSFITTLLHSEREKGRQENRDAFTNRWLDEARAEERERIVKMCEEMELGEARIPIPEIRGDSYRMGFNTALSDLRDKLSNK